MLGANQDILAYNLFAYCGNNPINFADFTGTAKEEVWEYLGFTYDGTMRDYRRMTRGLPPIAYDEWLVTGGTRQVNRMYQNTGSTQKIVTSVTYILPDKVKDYRIQRDNETRDTVGDTLLGKVESVVSLFSDAISWVATIFGIIDFEETDIAHEKDKLDEAINKGTGFLEWREVWRSSVGHRTEIVHYYAWDGRSDPF